MIDQSHEDLWKKAYQKEFGTDPDADMAEHKDDVENWRQNWQSGYDANEEWAKAMVDETAA